MVLAYAASGNGDVTLNYGNVDYWLFKLTEEGKLLWQLSLGGTGDDQGKEIQQTTDGGFIISGFTTSNDYFVDHKHGGYEHWVVKLAAPIVVPNTLFTPAYRQHQ